MSTSASRTDQIIRILQEERGLRCVEYAFTRAGIRPDYQRLFGHKRRAAATELNELRARRWQEDEQRLEELTAALEHNATNHNSQTFAMLEEWDGLLRHMPWHRAPLRLQHHINSDVARTARAALDRGITYSHTITHPAMQQPFSLCASTRPGHLLACDRAAGTVWRLAHDGSTCEEVVRGLNMPWDILGGLHDDIWITDSGNNQLIYKQKTGTTRICTTREISSLHDPRPLRLAISSFDDHSTLAVLLSEPNFSGMEIVFLDPYTLRFAKTIPITGHELWDIMFFNNHLYAAFSLSGLMRYSEEESQWKSTIHMKATPPTKACTSFENYIFYISSLSISFHTSSKSKVWNFSLDQLFRRNCKPIHLNIANINDALYLHICDPPNKCIHVFQSPITLCHSPFASTI